MKFLEVDRANWITGPGYRKHILLTDADLDADGTRVQIVIIKAKDTIGKHYHNVTREFYYVMSGECRLTLNDKQYHLTPGKMLMVEPGDIHSFQNDSTADFELLVFKTNVQKDDTYWLENT
ncbi:MAG: cupin domain-containing protein [Anaerolineae bacterium]|nr:cupin domain-containing protein [Anaerolineae bacterium]